MPPAHSTRSDGGCDESGHPREYLSFKVGLDEYAIDIMKVLEIRGCDQVTRIAGAPEFVTGILHLRGMVVPIFDLRVKFASGGAEHTPFTVLIILQVDERLFGIVVDSVSEVTALTENEIGPAAGFKSQGCADHIRGVASSGGRRLIVVDLVGLMSACDVALIDAAI